MQLLATGGVEKHGVTDDAWKVRTYPERYSFVQTVRAWGAWRKENADADCRLALYVVLDAVYLDIASGRIDVLELLVKEGETIAQDQGILEIETGKATMQVPSPSAGKVLKVHVAQGQTIPIGAVLLTLEGAAASSAPPKAAPAPAAKAPPAKAVPVKEQAPSPTPKPAPAAARKALSTSARP